MPHRSHPHNLRFAGALIDACWREPYRRQRLLRDLLAGVTVGIIAIPLAMALAIASGVAPQHGLYTAIVAGAIIALCGGSRFSVSGPTAAFVVILAPVSQQFGLAGLLMATLLSGIILIGMSLSRMGRLIEYIPEAVTLGFTGGIAIVIATLQLPDLLGVQLTGDIQHMPQRVNAILHAASGYHWPSLVVGGITLLTLILWPRLKCPIPGHLPAVIVGTAAAVLLVHWDHSVATIGSRFSYTLADGSSAAGIPPYLPTWVWPWQQAGANGQAFQWDFATFQGILPAAMSMAMLGAIESLLCAVVLDGMTGRRHHANGELLGQGIGNIVAPFFGGITATAAIARSAANVKAGAESPLAAVFHALIVLISLLLLAPWLAYLPMASMAALLLMVAWHMSEARKIKALIHKAPSGDILVLLSCLSLTVLFDMVIAIATGVVIAALLFIRDISQLTKINDISDHPKYVSQECADDVALFRINGPLFFAVADRIFTELARMAVGKKRLIVLMDGVSLLDAGGLSALNRCLNICQQQQQQLILCDLQFQPLKTLAKAELTHIPGLFSLSANLTEALEQTS